MKRLIFFLLLPLDGVLTVFVGGIGVIFAFLARFRRSLTSKRKAIFIVPGADIQSIHQKYDTLNVYLQDNPDYFDEVFRFLWGKINCRLQLRDNFTVIERRIRFPFMFYGIASMFFLMAQTVLLEDISLIHARDPYFCGLLGYILSFLSSRPFCVSIHADYDKRYELDGKRGAPTILGSRSWAKRLERFIFRRADMILPIREHLGEQAVVNGASWDKIRIIPHGIDLSAFSGPPDLLEVERLTERLKIDKNRYIISFAGRLSRENYVYDVIEVVDRLVQHRKDFTLVMAGGGNEEEQLRNIIHNNAILDNCVEIPGFLAHSDIILLRKISSVNLVLMGGFSLIEACASGNPVVAYDVEWHGELIKNGETGLLVPEGDIDALVDAVEYLLDHPEERRRLGEAAKRLAFERHSLERSAEIKRACYSELLKMNR